MKKIVIIALAILTFAGCQKSNTGFSSIYGKWYLSASNTTSFHNNTITGHSDSSVTAHTYYATFNADGTGVEYNTLYNSPAVAPVSFTYSASGDVITLNFPQQIINGVTYGATQENATVQTLAGNNLTLVLPVIIYGALGDSQTETQYFGK